MFESHRASCPADVLALVPTLPRCLTLSGWSIHPLLQDAWSQLLLNIPEVAMPLKPAHILAGSWVDVFSDGSCFWPESGSYNIAAWAITYASPELSWCQSDVLSAGPLPGLTQTAFRSEIYGALQAIRFGRRHGLKIRLWTDCLGVVKKLRNILRHKSIKPSSPHFDLWSEISEELEGLGHCNFVVTKVAAHQHIDEADGPLEQWAYLQNALVDRAARLANMCRDQHFWSVHASYAAEVESLKRITENVQKVILNIGRSAVERDAACQQDDGLLETVVEKADVKLPPVDPAYQLILPTTLPSSATKRFGFRQTSLLFSWLQHALSEAVETPPAWDFFLSIVRRLSVRYW